jgi:DNA-directed RNA polymerase subunit RPC12/RpoP
METGREMSRSQLQYGHACETCCGRLLLKEVVVVLQNLQTKVAMINQSFAKVAKRLSADFAREKEIGLPDKRGRIS